MKLKHSRKEDFSAIIPFVIIHKFKQKYYPFFTSTMVANKEGITIYYSFRTSSKSQTVFDSFVERQLKKFHF